MVISFSSLSAIIVLLFWHIALQELVNSSPTARQQLTIKCEWGSTVAKITVLFCVSTE